MEARQAEPEMETWRLESSKNSKTKHYLDLPIRVLVKNPKIDGGFWHPLFIIHSAPKLEDPGMSMEFFFQWCTDCNFSNV